MRGASADPGSHYMNRATGVAQPPPGGRLEGMGHLHLHKLESRILTFVWRGGAALLQDALGWPD